SPPPFPPCPCGACLTALCYHERRRQGYRRRSAERTLVAAAHAAAGVAAGTAVVARRRLEPAHRGSLLLRRSARRAGVRLRRVAIARAPRAAGRAAEAEHNDRSRAHRRDETHGSPPSRAAGATLVGHVGAPLPSAGHADVSRPRDLALRRSRIRCCL